MSRSMSITGPTLTAPRWAGDFGNREHLVPGGGKLDASAFTATDAVVVTVGAAGAAAAATSVPVDALSGPIPNGTVLNFGTDKFATLNAAAAAAATSLTTLAIPTALVDNDTATYAGVGTKAIPSGTVVGRTWTEQANEDPFGPADDADDEVYLIFHDVTDLSVLDDVTLYRHGGVVKVNFLPVWSALSAALKAAIRAAYATTTGAP